MAILDIRIHGRNYQIACDDGQEAHVKELSREIDVRIQEISAAMGSQVPDGTLLVLASLMISDELNEERETTRKLKLQLGDSSSFEQEKQQEVDVAVAGAIADIAADIEKIASALEKSSV